MRLAWLPSHTDWAADFAEAQRLPHDNAASRLIKLASTSMDFTQTMRLDRAIQRVRECASSQLKRTRPLRLALLGSSTLAHLVPSIRVACVRRGFWIDVLEGDYGAYHRELVDTSSRLYAFNPDFVLLSLDAHHVVAGEQHRSGRTLETLKDCWRMAREHLGSTVLQQTILPLFPSLLGNNEHRLPQSPHAIIGRVNHELREAADADNVTLLALDEIVQTEGIGTWFEPALWHCFKQEVHPRASHLYGDHVGRLIASHRGLSAKCLVLDLDNTLWGGVIGDDGIDGIHLGQGHAAGEAFVSFQRYAKALGERGVILAVCSKNDIANAQLPFEQHAEMVLRQQDIACFVANWEDKATNVRQIAERLNIGLDSIVFVDDNPFERNLIRRELPDVAVPELPDDPALYASVLASAGYFESVSITNEDRDRGKLYQQNAGRERLRSSLTDMSAYLRSLEMKLLWSQFTDNELARVTQLINKSNQFNLTTRRYSREEVRELSDNAGILTMQLSLIDAFGDNGLIAVVIGRPLPGDVMEIDTWLMSCRVLGRQVEEATLNLLVEQCRSLGIRKLQGSYLPTAKNGMVRLHYERLGFMRSSPEADVASTWHLWVDEFVPRLTFVNPVYIGSALQGEVNDERSNLQPAHAGIP